MDLTFPNVAAVVGLTSVFTMLVYVGALRSQYRAAEAGRARARASEEALREQENWFRVVFDGTSDLMALHRVEPGGRLVFEYINRSLLEFHSASRPGIDASRWIGRDLADVMRTDLGYGDARIETLLRPYRDALRTGVGTHFSHRSGEEPTARFHEGLVTPLKDASGRVVRLSYRGTDVTERRRSEGEIRRGAERFSSLLATSPVPIIITRLSDSLILAVSDSWTDTVGIPREQAVGRSVRELGLWVSQEEREAIVGQLEAGRPVLRLKTRFRIGTGQLHTLLYSASLITWNDEPAVMAFPLDVQELEDAKLEAQASSERFEKLFHTSPVPTLITRLSDGRILEMNDAYLRANSRPGEQLRGSTSQSLNMWTDPADREKFAADIAAGLPVRNRHMQFRNGSGEVRDYLYSAEPIDWYGEQAVVSFPVDVTELEAARRAAQALGARLATLVEASPIPIVVTRMSDATIAQANQAWLDFTGHPRETIARGTTTTALGLWPDPQERERIVQMLGRRETVRQVPVRHRRADGEVRDVLYSAEVIGWDDGPGVVAFPFDITELERMRSEAQASSERFEKVFELSPMPIVIGAAADGRYLAVNEGWLRLHGYTRAELEGETSLSLRVWANPADRATVHEMLSHGIEVRRLPIRFRRKSGEIFDTLYSASIIDWKGARAIIATPQDVTELNRAAQEIRRLNESLEDKVRQRTAALEEANRGLEAFSYSVSHDLRAPLRALSGFSALLAARPSVGADNEALGYALRVNAAATRMGTIVDALLNFSRLSRQQLVPRPVDLAGTVDSVIAELAQASAGRSLRWVVGDLPVVNGDPTLLRLVLQNLLDNAVKYTRNREEALIEVDAARTSGQIVIRVKDNGTGFDMQYADKLFGVFERLHTDNEFEGTGIGLANAQRIVQRHGGRIWCEAKPGAGACFYVALPA